MIFLSAQYFFLQAAAGFALLMFLVSFSSLGFGYYQLHLTTAFAFAVFALSVGGEGAGAETIYHLTLGGAGLMLVATVLYSTKWRLPFLLHAMAAACALPALLFLATRISQSAAWPGAAIPAAALFLINAALAASTATLATLAMNVGHWYLVRPRLGAQHLSDISAYLLAALIFRGVFLAPSLVVAIGASLDPRSAIIGTGLDFLIGGRLVVGYLAPLILSFMAFQTARIRSTQSATGLLFALLILIIIGEALGAFLTVARGVPW